MTSSECSYSKNNKNNTPRCLDLSNLNLKKNRHGNISPANTTAQNLLLVCQQIQTKIAFGNFKMSIPSSKTDGEKGFEGEKYVGAESYRTPEPSTPDTLVTNTISCAMKDDVIVKGGYQMAGYQGLPQITFGLIKPDGMEYLEEIERKIREDGFGIIRSRILRLSPEEVSSFYYEHYGEPYFPLLVMNMCEGPVKVYVLHRKDAVPMWQLLCGPTSVEVAQKKYPESLRALYGTPGNSYRNVCHASRSEEKAKEEIKFFFPEMVLEQNFQNTSDIESYIKEFVNPTLLEGLVILCKNKPLDPLQWLGEWLLMNNPNKPKMLREIAITPT